MAVDGVWPWMVCVVDMNRTGHGKLARMKSVFM